MGSDWNNLVKTVYAENKGKPGYSLGDAMKDASLRRKKGASGAAASSSESRPSKKSRRSSKREAKSLALASPSPGRLALASPSPGRLARASPGRLARASK